MKPITEDETFKAESDKLGVLKARQVAVKSKADDLLARLHAAVAGTDSAQRQVRVNALLADPTAKLAADADVAALSRDYKTAAAELRSLTDAVAQQETEVGRVRVKLSQAVAREVAAERAGLLLDVAEAALELHRRYRAVRHMRDMVENDGYQILWSLPIRTLHNVDLLLAELLNETIFSAQDRARLEAIKTELTAVDERAGTGERALANVESLSERARRADHMAAGLTNLQRK